MPNRTYISLNQEGTSKETRDLRADVGEFAYANQGVVVAPFDVVELGIGSWRYDAESWDDVENAPNLPSKGHFLVWVTAENTKEIRFVADEMRDESCVESRVGELIVIEGVAESWNYYVSNNETYKFGEIAVPGSYDKGKANDTKLRTLSADHVRQYAYMNRGKRVDVVNFNTTLTHGNTHIEFLAGSIGTPPTSENIGILRNEIAGCRVLQYWYPDNSDALFFRERSEAKVWGSWYSATAGNTLKNGVVEVPIAYKRGIPSGYQSVPVYPTWQSDAKYNIIQGFGIQVTDSPAGKIVSWTGTSVPFSANPPLYYNELTGALSLDSTKVSQWDNAFGWGNHALAGYLTSYTETDPTVPSWVKAISNTQITNWNTAFGWGNHAGLYPLLSGSYANPSWITSLDYSKITNTPDFAGLYVPITRQLTVSGTAGRVAVTGGTQSLAASRSWAVDLVTVNATALSAGTTTQVPVISADVYGRVTALSAVTIAFPAETDPTVPSWVKAITSAQITNWNAAFGWGNHAGLYPLLSGSYANPSWITSLDYSKITNTPDFAGLYVPITRQLTVSGTAGRVAVTGGTQSLSASRTWAIDLVTVNATALSAGTTTQVPVISADVYGRVTALSAVTIAFPVTSVNGKTGVVVLNTDDVSEGSTNQYWTNAKGDARYVQLSGSYVNPSWLVSIPYTKLTGVPNFVTQAYTTIRGNGVQLTQRNEVNFSSEFSATDNAANSRTEIAISSVPYAKVTGVPAFLTTETDPTVPSWVKAITSTQITNWNTAFGWGNHALAGYLTSYTETDPTVPSHVKAITTTNISSWNAKVAGAGTVNWLSKFVNTSEIGNSQISDDGTNVGIGSAPNAAYKVYVNGATYFQGDASDVALYLRSSTAIRSAGSLFIDAAGTSGRLRFRAGAGYTDVMSIDNTGVAIVGSITPTGTAHKLQVIGGLYATGQARLASYISSTSYTGTRAGLLGFDASGNVLSVANDVYADKIHGHTIGDTTGLQAALDGKTPWGHGHIIGDVSGLQAALDGKTPWGHNHDERYFTQGQLTTSGGSTVHWDNISNKPGLVYAGHGHIIGDVSGLQTALDGKTPWGHSHNIGDTIGLQAALDNRPTWDSVYTRTQSDGRYIQSESDPFGLDSHWFSVSGNTITLGIQRRNGTQQYASFTSPSASEYSLALSPFTSGLGHHQINLNKTGGGSSSVDIYEQDPYGLTDVSAFYNSSTKVLTLYHNLRNGTTKTLSVILS